MGDEQATLYCGNCGQEIDGEAFYFELLRDVYCQEQCVNGGVLKYVKKQREVGRLTDEAAREIVSTRPLCLTRENALELLVRGRISQAGLRREQSQL